MTATRAGETLESSPLSGSRPAVDSAGVRLRGHDMTRIETFTDAAFAFAVTLLVISIDAVPASVPGLVAVLEQVPAFALSFLQLTLFWHAHWKWSRRYGLEDFPSVALSLLLVFVVLVYVYPLRVMFSLLVAWLSRGRLGDATLGSMAELNQIFLIYGIGFCAMNLIIVFLYQHALRRGDALGLSALERLETRSDRDVMLILSSVGLASAVVSRLAPPSQFLNAGLVYMLIPIATSLHATWHGRRRRGLLAEGESRVG